MRTGYRLALGVAVVTIVLAVVLLVAELLGARATRASTARSHCPDGNR